MRVIKVFLITGILDRAGLNFEILSTNQIFQGKCETHTQDGLHERYKSALELGIIWKISEDGIYELQN